MYSKKIRSIFHQQILHADMFDSGLKKLNMTNAFSSLLNENTVTNVVLNVPSDDAEIRGIV